MNWSRAFTGAALGFQIYRIICHENLPAQHHISNTLFLLTTNAIDMDNKIVSNTAWASLVTQAEYEALMQDDMNRSE